jgi:hypothetical protein
MPYLCYVPKKFSAEHKAVIDKANEIAKEYAADGYDLTLRQLYYQFVARGLIENTDRSYKRLGTIVSDARRAGLIDWEHIVDRTRFLRTMAAWDSPAEIVSSCAYQFEMDRWAGQEYRPEVWIEKDALVGVLKVACEQWRVPYFSCRGYTSDSEVWSAAQRLKGYRVKGQVPFIVHLGDHDPSGIDMTRDIIDRLQLFSGGVVPVRRIALNMDQIEELQPPPNPAKVTDSRYAGYAALHGEESYELDALDPKAITGLIDDQMKAIIDKRKWAAIQKSVDAGRKNLRAVADDWTSIVKKLPK